jgi:hypothetical protein
VSFLGGIAGGLEVACFPQARPRILVQHIPIDIIEGELSLVVVELEGHEPLPIIEELKVVFVGLEHSSPCFRTASAREVLEWAGTTET